MPVPYLPLFNPDSASITIMNHCHLIALWGHLAQGLVNTTGEGPHSFRGRTPGFLRRSTRRLCALLKAGLSGLLKCLSENCSHTATAPGWWVWKHSFHLWKVENQRTFVSWLVLGHVGLASDGSNRFEVRCFISMFSKFSFVLKTIENPDLRRYYSGIIY